MIDDVNNDKDIYFDLERVPLKSERQERAKKRKNAFLIVLLCFFSLLAGVLLGYLLIKNLHPSYTADKKNTMGEIEYFFDNYWLYSNEYEDLSDTLEDKALYGMTSFENDPYTSYMSDEEMEEFSTSINMNYVGIGVEYSYISDIALVKRVFKNSPAEKAGIQAGDIIKAVDHEEIEGLTSSEIKQRVIGEEGSDVVISVLRGGEIIDLTITRGPVDSTAYAYKENDYAVLELNSFGVDSGDRCIEYLEEYSDLSKLIIDLRDNSGGYQSSVKEISGIFIGPNKVYLRQKDAKGVETADTTVAKKTFDNFKDIVVLINENTASAAEVLAICLKEQHPNVTLVGTTTYGKGVIQTNRLLNNNGVLKITAYYWYSPNGVSIDKVGLKPDVEVKMPAIYYEYYNEKLEETYEFDSVSDNVRLCQMILEYLGYDVKRTDGYFDESFAKALVSFKQKYNLEPTAVLDNDTYEVMISEVHREMINNPDKDIQMAKAKEILNGN